MAKRALVTGVTGQDGAYLCRLLLDKGYEVYGAYRRSAASDFSRMAELGITNEVNRVSFDLLEATNILRVVDKVQPDEVYNLGAQSFVTLSFEQPVYTADADALGVVRLLEALRTYAPKTKFYQASTSEMFGKVRSVPQNEETPFHPRSPYGVAKVYGHWITVNYRESYDMFACSGILFNHESPLRGLEFVTRKITSHLALVLSGKKDVLELGNMDAKRDWGFAGDFVEGMHLMLQHDAPDDYVLATGETHTVREFVLGACAVAGVDLEFRGEGDAEEGVDRNSGRVLVRVSPELYRPAEVEFLLGDSAKAKRVLGWSPKVTFGGLVEMMMRADLAKAAQGILRA